MEDNDAELHLKKRARRRLVGAIFFVSVVAVVLPVVMDREPRPSVQDVEIRIPGQDEKPFSPKVLSSPAEMPAGKSAENTRPQAEEKPVREPSAETVPAVKPAAKVLEASKDVVPVERPVEKPAIKVQDKSVKTEKKLDPPAVKTVEQHAEKPKSDDAKRAAAILSGQPPDTKPVAAKAGEYLVLIGAFSNEANVRSLKSKLGEQGIHVFTEPLSTPQGKKTRVRAGPFASREAADKALAKMKRIGVAGVVSAKP